MEENNPRQNNLFLNLLLWGIIITFVAMVFFFWPVPFDDSERGAADSGSPAVIPGGGTGNRGCRAITAAASGRNDPRPGTRPRHTAGAHGGTETNTEAVFRFDGGI